MKLTKNLLELVSALVGFKSRRASRRNSEHESRSTEIMQSEEKEKYNEEKCIETKRPVETIKCTTIFIMRLKIDTETILQKIMTVNIQNLMKT